MKGIQTILVGKCFRNVKDGLDMAIFIAYPIDHVGGFYRLVAAKVKKKLTKQDVIPTLRAAAQQFNPVGVYSDNELGIVGERYGINDEDKVLPILPNAKAKVVERDFYTIKHLLEG